LFYLLASSSCLLDKVEVGDSCEDAASGLKRLLYEVGDSWATAAVASGLKTLLLLLYEVGDSCAAAAAASGLKRLLLLLLFS
jgi:hypothetical protein